MKTKQEIIDYASRIADAKTAGRLRLVLSLFTTAEEFFSAAESKGALMAAYNKARPGGKKGVGRKFFDAIDRIKAFAKKSETQVLPVAPPPQEQPVKPDRFYTVQQLKALVSFMGLCGVKAIDLAGVDEFSKVMRFDVFKAMGC